MSNTRAYNLQLDNDVPCEEEIVVNAQRGHVNAQEYILEKYKHLVAARAKAYFIVGGDQDDLFQEGMIGLYKAIIDFNPDKAASFRFFAEMCITRQIITAVKQATRQKHKPLNSYVSLQKPAYDDSERTLLDLVSLSHANSPEDLVISKEECADILAGFSRVLSEIESKALIRHMQGKSYEEIAHELSCRVKAIDNALYRAKSKLARFLRLRQAETCA